MKIKICGLTNRDDLQFCQKLDIDYVGFIFHPPSPRNVSPSLVATWEQKGEKRVGVFVRQDADQVLEIMDMAGLDLAQLHGDQDEDFCLKIGPSRVIKVLWPERFSTPSELQKEMERFAPFCAYFLLDAGKYGGGHGRRMNCSFLNQIKPLKPLFLAGGLDIRILDELGESLGKKVFALDFNSGVEMRPGVKDKQKILELVQSLKGE
ncbi:phosphoribosylanthranilate isomerase [Desulfohalobiaceae bacterium Ax17]|uniref:phosphoribosylanthranilate isomerase n=1 Tax=Desulfovulcanus ferrireducens TaxID=2831190 RepID=UPI00207BB55C|nr:phosphoribosylanthranilate isomerase [Desulfovulcanus ferrireducens]MBT8762622.1 phosphoribosylanthranilate isomerase [Desulfovulcanus ferrireducens]